MRKTIEDKAREYTGGIDYPEHGFDGADINSAYIAGASLAVEFAEWLRKQRHITTDGQSYWIEHVTVTETELFTMFLNTNQ